MAALCVHLSVCLFILFLLVFETLSYIAQAGPLIVP